MSTTRELVKAIDASLDGSEELVVIHSSLPHLNPPAAALSRWELMNAIRDLLDRGITLALPTFTFSFCANSRYSYRTSPSETGLLGQWALGMTGFRRTYHPIYSFAVSGPLTSRLLSLESSTTFSEDSVFGFCDEINARVIMLGCGWEYCTQFHRCEEYNQVPYRYYKDFNGQGDLGDGRGNRDIRARMFVRDLDLDPVNEWSPLIAGIGRSASMRRVPLWSGWVESVRCADIVSYGNQLLKDDPWTFVKDGRQKRLQQRNHRKAIEQPSYKCAILGSSNLANLANSFKSTIHNLISDRRIETFTVPYGQLDVQVIDSASDLRKFDADITFFADRLEDLVGRAQWHADESDVLTERVGRYAETIRHYRQVSRGWLVVHSFSDIPNTPDFSHARPGILRSLNDVLANSLQDLENVHLLDMASLTAKCGVTPVDTRLWHLGRFPFAPGFDKAVAMRWAGLTLDALGRSVRLIALDLDNTLWGGILGDDGKAELKVGGDYPGNAYVTFQLALKQLSKQGVALAVVSKNDEANALDAIATLPAMVLRPEDIVGHRINWLPKSDNLVELCKEMSLGNGSVIFIDDNPVERERVRAEVPDVIVLDLPEDPAEYAVALGNCPWVSRLTLTREDHQRVAAYGARAIVAKERESFRDVEAFYASLGMTLHITPMDQSNRSRIQQLISKTNQFNATTRRYDGRDLDRFLNLGADILSVGLEDRFLGREEIGVLILDWHSDDSAVRIESYLLSCRVLGRGLETGIVKWVTSYAGRRGATLVVGEIIETERNQPVRSVYRECGFEPGDVQGEWRLDLRGRDLLTPTWLKIAEHFPADQPRQRR